MSDRRTILILSANPQGTNPLRLGKEIREIKRLSESRDLYKVETAEAVRVSDIREAMFKYRPKIVHFCGHGEGKKGLVFEDEMGQAQLVGAEALADLFGSFADELDCVLLNTCYSEVQAQKISQYINHVIGMSQKIGDRAAISFAVGFYTALGAGETVESCYTHGCNEINMQGISEHFTPELLTKASESVTPPTITTNHYVERPPIEETCCEAIRRSGGLIRIKAPQKMGKTLLLRKTLDHAKRLGYRTASIDFSAWGPNNSVFNDYDKFQESLCTEISRCLQIQNIESKISRIWAFKSATMITDYFEEYLLLENERELVVSFDRFEVLFDKLNIFENFCCVLRFWHDNPESQWQRLKLILVNSTDYYPKLDRNHSPFNVGTEVGELTGLTEFSLSQTKELLNFYRLEDPSRANEIVLQEFVDFVGGHPFLLDESFKYLQQNPTKTLQIVMEQAPTETGIFNHHLGEILESLDGHQYLKNDYIKILEKYPNSVKLSKKSAFNLRSLGLVKCRFFR
jgi:hypothetical protein